MLFRSRPIALFFPIIICLARSLCSVADVCALYEGGEWGAKQKKEYILDRDGNKIYDPKKRQYKCKSIPTTDWNEQTEAEQILLTAAKDYLKGVMNGKTTIPTKAWKDEYAKLTAERKTLKQQYSIANFYISDSCQERLFPHRHKIFYSLRLSVSSRSAFFRWLHAVLPDHSSLVLFPCFCLFRFCSRSFLIPRPFFAVRIVPENKNGS